MHNIAGDCDYLFKVVILGDAAVGKSSVLGRFADDKFADMYITTIGVDFKIRTMELDQKIVKLQMWDTAGQERFGSIVRSYYHGAHGFILVYDITNRKSFENIQKWKGEINMYGSASSMSFLIGNKVDLEGAREVPYDEAKKFADAIGLPFLETSAKSSLNVEQSFFALAAKLKDAVNEGLLKKQEQTHILTDVKSDAVGEDNSYFTCC